MSDKLVKILMNLKAYHEEAEGFHRLAKNEAAKAIELVGEEGKSSSSIQPGIAEKEVARRNAGFQRKQQLRHGR